jgi:hypothetical protein
MTLKYLKENWQKLSIHINDKDGSVYTIALKERFMLCVPSEALVFSDPSNIKKNCGKCLLFDTGGEQGNPAYLIKSDRHNNCLVFDVDKWTKIGKLVEIKSNERKRKRLKRLV